MFSMSKLIKPERINWNKEVLNFTNDSLEKNLLALGFRLEKETGHLYYTEQFQPLRLKSNIVVVRHGETYGNCGQSTKESRLNREMIMTNQKNKAYRIFQGNVDTEINQLTADGKKQAQALVTKMETQLLAQGFQFDLIFTSPLTRAKETALPFIKKYKLASRFFEHPGLHEQSFGAWENKRVCDFDKDASCHSFYQTQNALIKEPVNEGDNHTENFAEVLLRAAIVLQHIDQLSEMPHPNILIFGHSMFNAACYFLTGKRLGVENEGYLAFDGVKVMPHAEPIILNFELEQLKHQFETSMHFSYLP